MSSQIAFARSKLGNISILTISGEIDMNVQEEFDDAVMTAVSETSSPLIVDLSFVTYLDSTGLSVLYKASRRIDQQRDSLYIVVPEGHVRRVLRLTKFDSILDVRETLAKAVAAATAQG